MAELPKVNPVNIVMESEKYYDFDPSSFQRVLPTLKTVGGGIASILLPQDATDVAMMAVSPLAIFKRVKKILSEADSLDYQAMSSYNSYMRFGDDIDLKTYNAKKSRAEGLRKSISKEDKKIHDDYEKSLMGTKESNKRAAEKAKRIAATPDQEPDALKYTGSYSSEDELMQSILNYPGTIPFSPALKNQIKEYLKKNPQKVENLQLRKKLKRTKLDDLLDDLNK